MHLFIIRHGECLGQCDPEYYDDPDSPLSPRGEAQARAVAHRLRGEQVTHMLSSPLLRSLGTAHIIADVLDSTPIAVLMDMREAWDTPYRGTGRTLLQQRFPRAVLPLAIEETGWEHLGDANFEHVFMRATSILQHIKTNFGPTDRVALVTHGGLANAFLHAILHIAPTTPQWFELANGSISHVRLVPEPEKERPDFPLYPPVQAEVLFINQAVTETSNAG